LTPGRNAKTNGLGREPFTEPNERKKNRSQKPDGQFFPDSGSD
jgi:hypothetical protein